MIQLKKFIRENCADYWKKGECTGMTVDNKRFRPESEYWEKDPCWVVEGKRCPYFERYVLGPADYKFRPENYAVISGEYEVAVGL